MRARDHHLVRDDAVDDPAARRDRRLTVLIIRPLPFRMRPKKRGHIHHVVRHHQLLGAGGDEIGRMARRVAGRGDHAHAGRDFGVVFDEPPVLPAREDIGDALARRFARLGKFLDPAGLGPPVIFRAADDELGIREDGRVGALLHQAPDMVGMEMRDQDGADLRLVDAGGEHVGGQIGGVRLPLPDTGAGIDHDIFAADFENADSQRDRHEFSGQAGLRQSLLRLRHGGVFDESGVMRFAPDPVIDRRDFDIADFVFVESDRRLERRGGLRARRADEGDPPVKAESRRSRCGTQYRPA